MSPGVFYGLIAAVGWGIADFGIALIARRIGSFRTLVGATTGGAIVFSILAVILRPRLGISGSDWAALAVISLIAVPTYFAFFRGLELGPIGIVTPVVAAYAAIVVLLSLTLLGERLVAAEGIGVTAAMIGVVLAGADLRQIGGPKVGRGVWFGLVAMAGFGASAFGSAFYAQKYGAFIAAFVTRMIITATVLAVAGGLKQWPWQRASPALLGSLVIAGALESSSFLAFARGAELGYISIVAAASACYPVIPLVLGLTVLRERPAPNQLFGAAMVIGAVLLLATS